MATDNLSTMTQYLVTQLNANDSLGLQVVYFGDQELITKVPAVAVEPISVDRELIEARRFVNCTIELEVLIYQAQLNDRGATLKLALEKGEATMDILDALDTCGGNVLFSWCTGMEIGTAQRGSNLLAASRISFRAISQVQLAS